MSPRESLPDQSDTELRRLAFSPTDEERIAGARETSEKLTHTLQAYGRMELRLYETRRERDRYHEALLDAEDAIRDLYAAGWDSKRKEIAEKAIAGIRSAFDQQRLPEEG